MHTTFVAVALANRRATFRLQFALTRHATLNTENKQKIWLYKRKKKLDEKETIKMSGRTFRHALVDIGPETKIEMQGEGTPEGAALREAAAPFAPVTACGTGQRTWLLHLQTMEAISFSSLL